MLVGNISLKKNKICSTFIREVRVSKKVKNTSSYKSDTMLSVEGTNSDTRPPTSSCPSLWKSSTLSLFSGYEAALNIADIFVGFFNVALASYPVATCPALTGTLSTPRPSLWTSKWPWPATCPSWTLGTRLDVTTRGDKGLLKKIDNFSSGLE